MIHKGSIFHKGLDVFFKEPKKAAFSTPINLGAIELEMLNIKQLLELIVLKFRTND